MQELIVALVVGGVVGWLASLVMKTNAQMGILANVAVGVVGSALGHWLFRILGIAAFGAVGHWVMAVAGAAALIAVLKALRIYK
jgi:uncharacterized membrane protein YeaQ/YmgE (transglycosylase-associated protein family)